MSPPLVDKERDEMRKHVVSLYPPRGTKSIRAIATAIGRSYGLVWNLLEEAGVKRQPGKPSTKPAAAESQVPPE